MHLLFLSLFPLLEINIVPSNQALRLIQSYVEYNVVIHLSYELWGVGRSPNMKLKLRLNLSALESSCILNPKIHYKNLNNSHPSQCTYHI